MHQENKRQTQKNGSRDGWKAPAVALFFVLVASLALAYTASSHVLGMANALENEERAYIAEISAQIDAHIAGSLADSKARLARLAGVLAVTSDSRAEAVESFNATLGFDAVTLFDASGNGSHDGQPLSVAGEAVFQQALYAPQDVVAVYDYSPFDGAFRVLLATAFLDGDGTTRVLVAQDSRTLLARFVGVRSFDGQGAVFLATRRGEIIFRTGMEEALAGFDNLLTALGRMKLKGVTVNALSTDFHAGAQGFLHAEMSGDAVHLYYAPVPGSDWMLAVLVPGTVAHVGAERLGSIAVLTAVLAGAAPLAIAAAVYARSSRGRRRDTGEEGPSERLFRLMRAHIDDVFMVLGSQGQPEYVGENLERVTGVPHEEAAGAANGLAFLGTELCGQTGAYFAAGGTKPFIKEFEWRHRATGETRVLRLSVFPASADGDVHRVVLLADRTAERNTQRLMRGALEAAQSASETKTRFLSSMSHEIRTPLNGIIGMTRIALNAGGDVARMTDSLKKIDGSSKYLLDLINDVLDMSRIESGATLIASEPFSLGELLDGCAAMQRPQAELKGILFRYEKDDGCDAWIKGDALRVNQVLINILGNAMKFTPANGTVTFSAQVSRRMEDTLWLRFVISDTGVGMSEGFLPRLFEPFAQERLGAGAQQVGGTGLGMSITRNLIAMMNGTVGVKSRLNEGTTFTVEFAFPIADAAAGNPPVGDKVPDGTLAGASILLAEDNALNTEIMLAILEGLQIRAQNVTDGKQAVDAFAQAKPGTFDAVLMDIQMPIMDGLAATRAIRALDRPDAQTVPIIAITANAFREDVTRSLESGMTDHISKPVDPAQLSVVLARVLSGTR